LNDYLEAKKKSFPRFYFVSNQALLEILSNGNNPRRVDDFLADCFDGMKSMNLKPQDPADKTPMQGQGMISKENEEVKFGEGKNFICVGPVEVYLSNLEKKMQDTLGEILVEAKDSIDGWVEANEI
jgi:dynein heavy chain